MPIEHKMDAMEESPAEEMDDSGEEKSETASIPTSIVGDQKVSPGDVIRLQVVSADGDTITVKYADPEQEEKPMGAEAMASEFDK